MLSQLAEPPAVYWAWPEEWDWCVQAYLHSKESQVGNDLLNISSRSSQVSRKPLPPLPPPDDLFIVIFSV